MHVTIYCHPSVCADISAEAVRTSVRTILKSKVKVEIAKRTRADDRLQNWPNRSLMVIRDDA